MTFYDFKVELNQDECVQQLKLAFNEESKCQAAIFRWFTEFCRGRNSLQDEEHSGKPPTGLVKAIKLEGQMAVTANSYTTKCLTDFLQEVNVRVPMLHHDNASSHTARLTVEFLKQKQIIVIEHPPYSPDLAMCDFW
ncbi:histone-lysine N-methyltransferase SETMAR [Trichonephila clavipes]|nr:histone-lysine N-methyltransferase SETMAR [Trichonephila clavipes]